MKFISVSSTQATLSLGHSIANTNINLYSMDGTNFLQQNPTTPITPDDTTNSTQNVYNTPSGNYMAVFTMTAGTPTIISIQTDPYPCVYDTNAAI